MRFHAIEIEISISQKFAKTCDCTAFCRDIRSGDLKTCKSGENSEWKFWIEGSVSITFGCENSGDLKICKSGQNSEWKSLTENNTSIT